MPAVRDPDAKPFRSEIDQRINHNPTADEHHEEERDDKGVVFFWHVRALLTGPPLARRSRGCPAPPLADNTCVLSITRTVRTLVLFRILFAALLFPISQRTFRADSIQNDRFEPVREGDRRDRRLRPEFILELKHGSRLKPTGCVPHPRRGARRVRFDSHASRFANCEPRCLHEGAWRARPGGARAAPFRSSSPEGFGQLSPGTERLKHNHHADGS